MVALALGGCGIAETNQPLTVVEQKPAPPTGGGGAAGASGAGAACWAGQLPPEPLAPQPTLTVTDACRLAGSAKSWSFPTTWTGTSSIKNDDHDGDIVGRWVPCGQPTLVSEPHAGIEFGGNGRWQLLGADASGALVPSQTRGYYYVLGNGQLNFGGESASGGIGDGFVTFADGNRDVVRFTTNGDNGGSSVYARVAPSPTNGDDNTPSVSDGHCSMVGTWSVPANEAAPSTPASRWSFDAAGHFVVDMPSDDLCGAHTMWGTYRLSTDGLFQITQNWNIGLCDWWFTAAYPYSFASNCSTLTLTQLYDNCTGGRGYLNGMTKVTRLP
jgi:hypothetical protein